MSRRFLSVLLLLTLVGTGLLTGCVAQERPVVALLIASDRADRWSSIDEPTFAERVRDTCEGCVYVVRNAGGDAETQAEQFAEVVDRGADVVVLNPVDSERAEELVASPQAGGAPGVTVVAYDRFVAGADWFVSVDPAAIGAQIGRAVAEALPRGGRALVVNGARGDANAAAIAAAVGSRLDRAGIEVVAELDPDSWSGQVARDWVAGQLRTAGRLDAVVASNDVQAAGVVAALRAAEAEPWPVVTGQDAQLDALRRIVRGEQAVTVHKPIREEARRAADVAVRLLAGEKVEGAEPYEGVPSFLFEPVLVELDNLTSTVVSDGSWRIEEICSGAVRRRCDALGLV